MDCSLPGSSVHGILQARILEWVTISFSRGSSWPRDWTQVSHIGGRRFNLWATREAWIKSSTSFFLFWAVPFPDQGLNLCLLHEALLKAWSLFIFFERWYHFLKSIFKLENNCFQWCVGFCHTTRWISHKYTYVPSLPHPTLCHPSRLSQRIWTPCVTQQMPISSLFYICKCTCFSATFSVRPTLPSPAVSTNLFSMSVSLFLPCK